MSKLYALKLKSSDDKNPEWGESVNGALVPTLEPQTVLESWVPMFSNLFQANKNGGDYEFVEVQLRVKSK